MTLLLKLPASGRHYRGCRAQPAAPILATVIIRFTLRCRSEDGNDDPQDPLLIDTDPGVDDALALLMAFADERHDVVALTIAAGNVGLQYTVRNALKLCDIVGRTDVPVFCRQPGSAAASFR